MKTVPDAEPQGIPVNPHNKRLALYGSVRDGFPFAALLYRRGNGDWTAYQGKTSIDLSREASPFQLSINSITRVRLLPDKPWMSTPSKIDDYWLPDSGAFTVSILVGKFDFPVPLDRHKRWHLLKKFD